MKTNTATYSAQRPALADRLATFANAIATHRRHQQELESLRNLNDRLLCDVGLIRHQVSNRWSGLISTRAF